MKEPIKNKQYLLVAVVIIFVIGTIYAAWQIGNSQKQVKDIFNANFSLESTPAEQSTPSSGYNPLGIDMKEFEIIAKSEGAKKLGAVLFDQLMQNPDAQKYLEANPEIKEILISGGSEESLEKFTTKICKDVNQNNIDLDELTEEQLKTALGESYEDYKKYKGYYELIQTSCKDNKIDNEELQKIIQLTTQVSK